MPLLHVNSRVIPIGKYAPSLAGLSRHPGETLATEAPGNTTGCPWHNPGTEFSLLSQLEQMPMITSPSWSPVTFLWTVKVKDLGYQCFPDHEHRYSNATRYSMEGGFSGQIILGNAPTIPALADLPVPLGIQTKLRRCSGRRGDA